MSDRQRDERFMLLALEQARAAAAEGEVPVGAVIVRGDTVVSLGRNRRESSKNALTHAEIEAIDAACRTLGGWRLHECELYVTLEPCPMCMGAAINARIRRLVFGASDPKNGACGSVVNLNDFTFTHHPELSVGCLENECSVILTSFFAQLRAIRQGSPKGNTKS